MGYHTDGEGIVTLPLLWSACPFIPGACMMKRVTNKLLLTPDHHPPRASQPAPLHCSSFSLNAGHRPTYSDVDIIVAEAQFRSGQKL